MEETAKQLARLFNLESKVVSSYKNVNHSKNGRCKVMSHAAKNFQGRIRMLMASENSEVKGMPIETNNW